MRYTYPCSNPQQLFQRNWQCDEISLKQLLWVGTRYVYLKLLPWHNTIFRNYRIRHLHALGVVSSRVEPGDGEGGRVALRLAPPGDGWLVVAALVEEEDPCRWTGDVAVEQEQVTVHNHALRRVSFPRSTTLTLIHSQKHTVSFPRSTTQCSLHLQKKSSTMEPGNEAGQREPENEAGQWEPGNEAGQWEPGNGAGQWEPGNGAGQWEPGNEA